MARVEMNGRIRELTTLAMPSSSTIMTCTHVRWNALGDVLAIVWTPVDDEEACSFGECTH